MILLGTFSPLSAMRLRLMHCMSWVKQWSEAMDFLQTIFKTNIFLSRILEIYIKRVRHTKSEVKDSRNSHKYCACNMNSYFDQK